jgi:hypothetical protein
VYEYVWECLCSSLRGTQSLSLGATFVSSLPPRTFFPRDDSDNLNSVKHHPYSQAVRGAHSSTAMADMKEGSRNA